MPQSSDHVRLRDGVAGAALLKAAVRARNQAFIVIVFTNKNRKKTRRYMSIVVLLFTYHERYSQGLSGGLLKTRLEH